jgi:hypothetical protein
MADGTIPMPFDSYKDYTIEKDSGATYWSIARYHVCKQGKTAYVQIIFSVTADQDTTTTAITTLPDELWPDYNVEFKVNSLETGTDYNVIIYNKNHANKGKVAISRRPTLTAGNSRICVSYPLP